MRSRLDWIPNTSHISPCLIESSIYIDAPFILMQQSLDGSIYIFSFHGAKVRISKVLTIFTIATASSADPDEN